MGKIKPLSFSELSVFCMQMGMILKSGIPLAQGLEILELETQPQQGKTLLMQVKNTYEENGHRYEALKASHGFPDYLIDMIELAELTGNTEKTFYALAEYYQQEHQILHHLKNAIRYPFVMAVMAGLVLLVLFTQVLPVFSQIFGQLGTQLNPLSLSIIKLSESIQQYSLALIAILAIGIALYLFAIHTQKGNRIANRFLQKFFITKGLYQTIGLARFTGALSMMVSSGIDLQESLNKAQGLTDNLNVHKNVQVCLSHVQNGEPIETALCSSGLFTGIYGKLAAVAFQTGNTDAALEKLAYEYAQQANEEINRKISLIEPAMVTVFALLVGFILLCVMLPLMGVMASLG